MKKNGSLHSKEFISTLRLLLDENVESVWFGNRLRKAKHDVAYLKDLAPKGTRDEVVLSIAAKDQRVLYTRDRDFLELSAQHQNHAGIIFEYRTGTPGDMTIEEIISALAKIKNKYRQLQNHLIIINSFRKRH